MWRNSFSDKVPRLPEVILLTQNCVHPAGSFLIPRILWMPQCPGLKTCLCTVYIEHIEIGFMYELGWMDNYKGLVTRLARALPRSISTNKKYILFHSYFLVIQIFWFIVCKFLHYFEWINKIGCRKLWWNISVHKT